MVQISVLRPARKDKLDLRGPIPLDPPFLDGRDTLIHSCIEVESIKDIVLLKCLQNPFRISLILKSVFEKEHVFWILYPPLKEGKLFTLLFCKGKSQSKPFLGYDTVKDEIRFCDGDQVMSRDRAEQNL